MAEDIGYYTCKLCNTKMIHVSDHDVYCPKCTKEIVCLVPNCIGICIRFLHSVQDGIINSQFKCNKCGNYVQLRDYKFYNTGKTNGVSYVTSDKLL